MFTFLRHELVIQNYQNDELDPDPKISCCIRTPDKISYEISLFLAAVTPPPPACKPSEASSFAEKMQIFHIVSLAYWKMHDFSHSVIGRLHLESNIIWMTFLPDWIPGEEHSQAAQHRRSDSQRPEVPFSYWPHRDAKTIIKKLFASP